MEAPLPFAHTEATRLIAGAVSQIQQSQGLSLRHIAEKIGYKSSVALSHLATGRAPVPLEKAIEIADGLGLDRRTFALAVFEQRHPDLSAEATAGAGANTPLSERDLLVRELEDIAGSALHRIDPARMAIVREVLADRDPGRRWLRVEEMPIIAAIRDATARLGKLTPDRRQRIIDAAGA